MHFNLTLKPFALILIANKVKNDKNPRKQQNTFKINTFLILFHYQIDNYCNYLAKCYQNSNKKIITIVTNNKLKFNLTYKHENGPEYLPPYRDGHYFDDRGLLCVTRILIIVFLSEIYLILRFNLKKWYGFEKLTSGRRSRIL